MALSAKKETEISVLPISQGLVRFCVVGNTPFIFNRMAEKAKRDLLLGGRKKNAADKAANLKHNPPEEYRASVYRNKGDDCATRLAIPSPAFKGGIAQAALDMPGARKSEIERLTWVDGTYVDFYGKPELFMNVVRSADIARTPDIRTRAIVRHWACQITISFIRPPLNETTVGHLLAAAGLICGVGDFRQGKGKGNFGQFRLVDFDDEDYRHIVETGGRQVQDQALQHYGCYDEETQELLDFYLQEVIRLGRQSDEDKPVRSKKAPRSNGAAETGIHLS